MRKNTNKAQTAEHDKNETTKKNRKISKVIKSNCNNIDLQILSLFLLLIVSCQFDVVKSYSIAEEWTRNLLSDPGNIDSAIDSPINATKLGEVNSSETFSGRNPKAWAEQTTSNENLQPGYTETENVAKRSNNNILAGVVARGSPCLCNDRYYRECPTQQECTSHSGHQIRQLSNSNNVKTHDIGHITSHKNQADYNKNANTTLIDTGDTVVFGHNKVLLKSGGGSDYDERLEGDLKNHPNFIGQVRLKIPVYIPGSESKFVGSAAGVEQRPHPLFKYKKYVQVESKPEIQMVPVTTTIISPRLVTT